jgi:hypothetical protein
MLGLVDDKVALLYGWDDKPGLNYEYERKGCTITIRGAGHTLVVVPDKEQLKCFQCADKVAEFLLKIPGNYATKAPLALMLAAGDSLEVAEALPVKIMRHKRYCTGGKAVLRDWGDAWVHRFVLALENGMYLGYDSLYRSGTGMELREEGGGDPIWIEPDKGALKSREDYRRVMNFLNRYGDPKLDLETAIMVLGGYKSSGTPPPEGCLRVDSKSPNVVNGMSEIEGALGGLYAGEAAPQPEPEPPKSFLERDDTPKHAITSTGPVTIRGHAKHVVMLDDASFKPAPLLHSLPEHAGQLVNFGGGQIYQVQEDGTLGPPGPPETESRDDKIDPPIKSPVESAWEGIGVAMGNIKAINKLQLNIPPKLDPAFDKGPVIEVDTGSAKVTGDLTVPGFEVFETLDLEHGHANPKALDKIQLEPVKKRVKVPRFVIPPEDLGRWEESCRGTGDPISAEDVTVLIGVVREYEEELRESDHRQKLDNLRIQSLEADLEKAEAMLKLKLNTIPEGASLVHVEVHGENIVELERIHKELNAACPNHAFLVWGGGVDFRVLGEDDLQEVLRVSGITPKPQTIHTTVTGEPPPNTKIICHGNKIVVEKTAPFGVGDGNAIRVNTESKPQIQVDKPGIHLTIQEAEYEGADLQPGKTMTLYKSHRQRVWLLMNADTEIVIRETDLYCNQSRFRVATHPVGEHVIRVFIEIPQGRILLEWYGGNREGVDQERAILESFSDQQGVERHRV